VLADEDWRAESYFGGGRRFGGKHRRSITLSIDRSIDLYFSFPEIRDKFNIVHYLKRGRGGAHLFLVMNLQHDAAKRCVHLSSTWSITPEI
jgi:hypothetical protein